MKIISKLEKKIRDYVNDNNLYDKHFKNDSDEWITLCVAMDILGDSCLALEYYEVSGLGNDDGEKYLKLYGLLQAVFLQQDSIRSLYRIFVGRKLEADCNTSWMTIRDLRNLTVGHPIETKEQGSTKRCFISRISIDSNGFELIIWDKDKGKDEFRRINLKSLYESYKLEAIKHLDETCESQVKNRSSLNKI